MGSGFGSFMQTSPQLKAFRMVEGSEERREKNCLKGEGYHQGTNMMSDSHADLILERPVF